LIAALQAAVPDPLLKAALSCIAPVVVDIFIRLYGVILPHIFLYIDQLGRRRAQIQAEKERAKKLRSAEAKLREALHDPHLSESDKRQLQESFANGRKALAQQAISDAFQNEPYGDEASTSSDRFQGSATG